MATAKALEIHSMPLASCRRSMGALSSLSAASVRLVPGKSNLSVRLSSVVRCNAVPEYGWLGGDEGLQETMVPVSPEDDAYPGTSGSSTAGAAATLLQNAPR